jgi:hypothetical protein
LFDLDTTLMAIAEQITPPPLPEGSPPLENGDRLTRDEFCLLQLGHRLEMAFELIAGVVYFPSRVCCRRTDAASRSAMGSNRA